MYNRRWQGVRREVLSDARAFGTSGEQSAIDCRFKATILDTELVTQLVRTWRRSGKAHWPLGKLHS